MDSVGGGAPKIRTEGSVLALLNERPLSSRKKVQELDETEAEKSLAGFKAEVAIVESDHRLVPPLSRTHSSSVNPNSLGLVARQ